MKSKCITRLIRSEEGYVARPVIYARVSKDSNDEDLVGQITHCREVIAKQLPDIDAATIPVIQEINNLERYDPGDEVWRLLELCTNGTCNTIIVKELNRLYRSTTQEGVRDVRSRIETTLANAGTTILSNDGRFKPSKVRNFADAIKIELGSENKRVVSKGIQDGVRAALRDGTFIPPAVPFGYRIVSEAKKREGAAGWDKFHGWAIDPDEGKVVRDIFAVCNGVATEFLDSFTESKPLSPSAIASWLNSQRKASREKFARHKCFARGGDVWNESIVRRLLRNTAYYGKVICNYGSEDTPFWDENFTAEIAVPGVVSEEWFNRAQKVAIAREVRNLKNGLYDWAPLHGILGCRCGSTMGVVGKSSYRCTKRREAGDGPHDEIPSKLANYIFAKLFSTDDFVNDLVKKLKDAPAISIDSARIKSLTARREKHLADLKRILDLQIDATPSAVPILREKEKEVHEALAGIDKDLRGMRSPKDDSKKIAAMIEVQMAEGNFDTQSFQSIVIQQAITTVRISEIPALDSTAEVSEASEQMGRYFSGEISSAEAAALIGSTPGSIAVRYRSERHPILKGLEKANYKITISLAGGTAVYVKIPEILGEELKTNGNLKKRD